MTIAVTPPPPRRAVRAAALLCVVITLGVLVQFAARLLRQSGELGGLQLLGEALLSVGMPIAFATVGALIVSRQPRNTIGWLLMLPALLILIGGPIDDYLRWAAQHAPEPAPALVLLAAVNTCSWLLLVMPLLFIPLLFPHGRPPTPRWRWVSRVALVWPALFVLIVTLTQQVSSNTTPELLLDNPIGVLDRDTTEALIGPWVVGLNVLVVLCVAALVARFRRAARAERQQIAWLLYASAVFVVVYGSGSLVGWGGSTDLVGNLWDVAFGLNLVAFPIAIGIAILRYQLFDIEVIVQRTLVYALLTGALALVYLTSVITLQALLRAVAGQTSDLAIVGSTLVIAALFQPLRRRIQSFIDHRFHRRAYDAAAILTAHAAALRDEVDTDDVTATLVGAVDDALRPGHATLWVRPTDDRP